MAETLNCRNEDCPSKRECKTHECIDRVAIVEETVVYKFDEWTGRCGHWIPFGVLPPSEDYNKE
jgi:hypothetical protein